MPFQSPLTRRLPGLPPRTGKLRSKLTFHLALRFVVVFVSFAALLSVVISNRQAAHSAPSNSAVLTYKGDASRTGEYLNETNLTTSNVNVAQFGKRMTYPTDGYAYAQPLYVPNVMLNGSVHNVVYVATAHDSVYAFDADNVGSTDPLWHTSFINPPAVTSVSSSFVGCGDLAPEIGITGTPVIDANTQTIYLISDTNEGGKLVDRLHALDITTGQEKSGSPIQISASVPGTGDGSVNGIIPFKAAHQHQRPGLLLQNGVVYAAWGSYCDNGAWHGWVMGYNATTLQQVGVYNASVETKASAFWQSGAGLAADSNGNIYAMTGNGDFDLNTGGSDAGDSLLKLSTQNGIHVADSFTPFNQSCLNLNDGDLASGGVILLPPQSGNVPNEIVGVAKEGRVYVFNRDNLGGYTTIADPCNNQTLTNVDNVVQELPPKTAKGGVWGMPAYWNGSNGQYVYMDGVGDHIKAFKLDNGLLSTSFTSQSPEYFNYPGVNPVISSNGTTSGTGILWAIDPKGILRAYDATDLSKELYSSDQNVARDTLGNYVKFTTPVVANGEVFVGTQNNLSIYGLLSQIPTPTGTVGTATPTPTFTPTPVPTPSPAVYNNTGTSDDSAPASGHFDGVNSYSAQALQGVGITPGATITFNGVQFSWPNAPSGKPNNYKANGQLLPVTPVSGATTLAFLGAASAGAASGVITLTYTDGSTQNITLGFTDWTTTNPPSFGNQVVVVMPYRNTPTGPQTHQPHVYYAEVPLAAGKTLQSVTLPLSTAVTGGQLHVFSISTK